MNGKYRLTTLGCKVNQYESQQVREVLESHGLRPAAAGEPAKIAVVNTCAVTGTATRKNRQAIRRLARGGRTPVVVIGCGATAENSALRQLRGVCAVLGHDHDVLSALRALLADQLGLSPTQGTGDAPAVSHGSPNAERDEQSMKPAVRKHERSVTAIQTTTDNPTRRLPIVNSAYALTGRIESFSGHQRAFLKVQDGCDAYCTYCIIPRLRPGLRWKPVEAVVDEARGLVRSGHKEIIVTGIFLGAYGRETAVRKRWAERASTGYERGHSGGLWDSGRRNPLADLVDALADIDGLTRVRMSSLEPGDIDDGLLKVLASRAACVPHLHLPLQSGSPEILRRMNRQYGVDDFLAMIERVQATLDRPAITTDIIVGFPGESEADFQASIDVAKAVGFCKIHAFPFSPREGTAAAKWSRDFVHPAVVRERMQRLADVERESSLAFRRRCIGTTERVIIESSAKNVDATAAVPYGDVGHGRSDRYFEIHFPRAEPSAERIADTSLAGAMRRQPGESGDHVQFPAAGDVVFVHIDRVTPTRTHGTLLPSNGRAPSASRLVHVSKCAVPHDT